MVSLGLTVLAWCVTICFFLSVIKTRYSHQLRILSWVLFGAFSLALAPHFWIEKQSIIEAVLALAGTVVAIRLSILSWNQTIRLDKLSLWIAITGSIILAVNTVSPIQNSLIGIVASNTTHILQLLGFSPTTAPAQTGWLITFTNTEPLLRTRLVTACTGIGSIAIFIGLITVLDTTRKVKIMIGIISTTIIYALNIVRNVFIAGAYAGQWLNLYPNIVAQVFGSDEYLVSYYIADKVISQFASLIVLIGLGLLVLQYTSREDKLTKELISVYNGLTKRNT